VNAGEPGIVCAAREVMEETGIDIEGMLQEEHFIKVNLQPLYGNVFIKNSDYLAIQSEYFNMRF
jgi:8-oxo-dGTP pyrophosphatase MutT (NUDIX family)